MKRPSISPVGLLLKLFIRALTVSISFIPLVLGISMAAKLAESDSFVLAIFLLLSGFASSAYLLQFELGNQEHS